MSRPRTLRMCAVMFTFAFAFACGLAACGSFRTMTASPRELEDYRAYRVAAAQGTRLARAQTYLVRHPHGAFAAEVRLAFETEEPRYFARAQRSREAARDYLADLPDGPHAEAALALLRVFATSMQEAELADLTKTVRSDDARLEALAVRRRAVGQAVVRALDLMFDPRTYGTPEHALSDQARALLEGPTPRTWGTTELWREQDFFFDLPTRPVRESRLVTLRTTVAPRDGVVASAKLEARDLFVRWMEADQILPVDPTSEDDRTEAQIHAMRKLEKVIDAHMPERACPEGRGADELFHRVCPRPERPGTPASPAPGDGVGVDARPPVGPMHGPPGPGWEVIVRAGGSPEAVDSILVRSPIDTAYAAHDAAGHAVDLPSPAPAR